MSKRQHPINKAAKNTNSKKQKIAISHKEYRNQIAAICLEVDKKEQQKLQQHHGKDFSTLTDLEQLIREYASFKYSMEVENSEGDSLVAIAFFADDCEVVNILKEHGANSYIPQEKYPLDKREITIGSLTVINDQNNDQELVAIPQTTNPDNIQLNVEKDNKIIEETATTNRTNNRNSNQNAISKDFNIYPLRQLAEKYSLQKIVQFYLNNKVNLDYKDKEGNTLLHIAIETGNIEIIDLLLDKKVDIYAQDNEGNTSIHLAARLLSKDKEHYTTIIIRLFKNGADFKIGDQQNNPCPEIINVIKEILEQVQQTRSLEKCITPPAQGIATAVPVPVIVKSVVIKEMQPNFAEAPVKGDSIDHNNSSILINPNINNLIPPIWEENTPTESRPIIQSICFLVLNIPSEEEKLDLFRNATAAGSLHVESRLPSSYTLRCAAVCPSEPPSNPVLKANSERDLLDKVKAAFDSLQQQWAAAGERYKLTLSSFTVVSLSEHKQAQYIASFIKTPEPFKLLQAIANDLATNLQEFNDTIKTLNRMVHGRNSVKDFIDIGEAFFLKNTQDHYNIKEETKFLLGCISLTDIAATRNNKDFKAKDIVQVIKILIEDSRILLPLLQLVKSEPSKCIEATKTIEEWRTQCGQILEHVISLKDSGVLINKVKTKCIEIINNVNLSNVQDDHSTTIMDPNAEINDIDEDEIIDVVNFTPPPNNIEIINCDFLTPVEETSTYLLGNIFSQNNIDTSINGFSNDLE
ncbi:ankyrin repeat domain-containing protein [Candidatus Tisiphia endosymbiont of Beris chalybata]|uniref:ankyrin repeat domain-containing protein n=1 Tax=Candidatus Tisiphia endosymbiont of Beris chalybata TaxID=3066262 RepID=UPI00312CB930